MPGNPNSNDLAAMGLQCSDVVSASSNLEKKNFFLGLLLDFCQGFCTLEKPAKAKIERLDIVENSWLLA